MKINGYPALHNKKTSYFYEKGLFKREMAIQNFKNLTSRFIWGSTGAKSPIPKILNFNKNWDINSR